MTHKISRRQLLKLGAAGAATAVMAGCQTPRPWVVLAPYVRPPEQQLSGVATWYASTCRQCPAGCGIVARIMNGRALKLEGNPEHPLNQGKLCARGQAGLQVLYNPDRITGPVQQSQRGTRTYEPLAWEAGINTLYEKLNAAGDKVAVWTNSTVSGHLLDLFGRFTAAVGAPTPVVYDLYTGIHGHRLLADVSQELFGQAALPSYNLSHADVVLSFGADFLGTWLSAVRYGMEFGGFRGQPLGKRGYFVHLEPRMTTNAVVADHWVPIRAGAEGLVAAALMRIIADEAIGPADRVAKAQSLAGDLDVGSVATASGLSAEELVHLAHTFVSAERPVAIPGAALTGVDNGVEAVSAVQALNLVTGSAGSLSGLTLSPPSPSEAIIAPEPAAYSDVQALIEQMRAGQIEVLMLHGANPAYDLPEQAGFLDALGNVPFVVSFAPMVDETAVWADLILPDRTYLEGWGYALVSPGFDQPVVSSQQPVVTPVFDSRSTADILLTVSKGIPAAAQALPWPHEVAFLKELVDQLGPGAAGGSGAEVLFSRFQQNGGWWPASPPASVAPSPATSSAIEVAPPAYQGSEGEYPFFLYLYSSALLSDGRGASQPWLQGSPDPMTTISWQTWVELHPETAEKLDVKDGDIVRVTSPEGELEAPVYVYPAIRPDTVGIPFGQGHTDCGRYARDRGGNPMQLVGTRTDTSGSSLAWANLRVNVRPTGEKQTLALFESKVGVTQGFLNTEFPE
ncbi:MAG TPA: molybdopterin dinucleotide binding domain-containing protein [Anaerolineae bacterium]|nr:molybdopterin dinucleotide binding domain-containing protein [Anaerolineae bacterium]